MDPACHPRRLAFMALQESALSREEPRDLITKTAGDRAAEGRIDSNASGGRQGMTGMCREL